MSLSTAAATVIKRGITGRFDLGFGRVNNMFYPQICTVMPSDGYDENYGFIGAMPGVREWLGDRVFKELRAGEYRIKNKTWEDSLKIDRHDLDDDRMNMYGPYLEQLGMEAAMHPDELLFETLLAGETDTGFDDIAFFATTHAWGDSGTQSNLLTKVPDGGAAAAIIAKDIKEAFNDARVALLRFKNDQGKYYNRTILQRLSQLMLLIPPELEQVAVDALYTQIFSFQSDVGGENITLDRPQIVTTAHLTNTRQMYTMFLGAPMRPFVFQQRAPLRRDVDGLDGIRYKEVLAMTEARYNVGYGPWFTAVKTTFS